ncbi:MAG: bifunctional oligoribonuclease/PAP phosphatase NrnA [Actinobacteria bacterium]|nr:bifunctional oligoribonuclease/PAP phosphatase NrnA [Actinomycetota bacterium]
MRRELQIAVDRLKGLSRVAIASHVDPDGDAVGSLFGMALILTGMGKEVTVRWPKGTSAPSQYDFLPGRELVGEAVAVDAFVALDCGSFGRLGSLMEEAKKTRELINIDHHPDNDLFGTVNVVESRASSTSEIIYDFTEIAGVKIGKDVALCLYVGIVTDTGRFQYSNTTARTHLIAADLVEKGNIDIAETFHKVYERISYGSLMLLSSVVGSAVLLPEARFVYSVATRKMIDETGGRLEELENLIDYLRVVRDADVAALARELPDGRFRVSLRSKGAIDVSKIARRHGGGGHRNAAAFLEGGPISESLNLLLAEVGKARQEIAVGRDSGNR